MLVPVGKEVHGTVCEKPDSWPVAYAVKWDGDNYISGQLCGDDLIPENESAIKIISELCDPEDCDYDHHGYCQAHSLHKRPCPHERAKMFLEKHQAGMKARKE